MHRSQRRAAGSFLFLEFELGQHQAGSHQLLLAPRHVVPGGPSAYLDDHVGLQAPLAGLRSMWEAGQLAVA